MGIYVNPGNGAFREIADSDYVDKTGLIGLINQTVCKKNKLTCISRPRRFGKSYAAKMLAAYYDRTCDSHPLFDHRRIARTKDYETHLNQYNVICLDVSGFVSAAQKKGISLREVPERMDRAIHAELADLDPEWKPEDSLEEALIRSAEAPGGTVCPAVLQ